MYLKTVFYSLWILNFGNCANILGIFFHAGKSHHILGEILFKELARRGHNVTMISPFPLKQPFPNYTDIHLTGIHEDQISRENSFMEMNEGNVFTAIENVIKLTKVQTELTLNHTIMEEILKSGTKFDLIVIDWFLNFAMLVYGHLFDAPIIPIASQGTTNMINGIVGNPSPLSYIPLPLLPFPSNMSFLQRLINLIVAQIIDYAGKNLIIYHHNLIQKYYNNSPNLYELRNRIALIFSNSHYSFESPRPLVPNIIPVGGFHVDKPKKLPQDLQQYMDQAENGVIYFSLGSNMKSVLLPKEKQLQILKAFSKIKYKILWKWENDDMPEKPDNVLIRNWFPQNDILAHPNLKLFISHGGLLSIIEALHYGVPILGIPIFADQFTNIPNAVRAGYALQLNLHELNENTLLKALDELKNPVYAQNAKKQSLLFHDRPLKPIDQAIFWVEHVIRHKGAPHLRNAGINLSWFKYFLLDIIGCIVGIILVFLLLVYFVIKKICGYYKKFRRVGKKEKTA